MQFGGKTILRYSEIKITLDRTVESFRWKNICIIVARGSRIGKKRSVIALSLWTGICTSLSWRVSRTKGD